MATIPSRTLALLLLLAPATLWADDRTLDDFARMVTPQLRKAIDEQIVLLNRWPDREAQQAARALVDIGEPVVADIYKELREGHWKAQLACAQIAGDLRTPILAEAIEGSARGLAASAEGKVRSQLRVPLRALARIDRARGCRLALQLVGNRRSDVRRMAEAYALGLIDKGDQAALEAGLSHREPEARAAYARMLDALGAKHELSGGGPKLLAALEDDKAEVAAAAAAALAHQMDEATAAKLEKQMVEPTRMLRSRAYALLALVERDRLGGEPRMRDALAPPAIRLLSSRDPFAVAVASAALADLARRSELPEVTDLADRALVPALIKATYPAAFSDDLQQIKPLTLERLRELTGQRWADRAAWIRWWKSVEGSFRVVRRLERIAPGELAKLAIVMARTFKGAIRQQWRFARGRDDSFKGSQFVLTEAEQAELWQALARQRVLQLPATGVARLMTRTRVSIQVGQRQRALVAAAQAPPWMTALTDTLDAVAIKLEWQRYRDQSDTRYPNWQAWYDAQRKFWSDPTNSELDRNRRLKGMIISSLQWLPGGDWPDAAERLRELVETNPEPMRETQAGLLMSMVLAHVQGNQRAKEEDPFDQIAYDLCLAAARSRQPVVMEPLVAMAATAGGERGRVILEVMMEHLGPRIAQGAIRSQNAPVPVKAAAVASLWRYRGKGLDEFLISALQAEQAPIRESACRALGRRRGKLAIPSLQRLTRDASPAVAQAALLAIGQCGGASQVEALGAKLRGAADSERAAVARALAATEAPGAVPLLLEAALGEEQLAVATSLGESLLSLPRAPVREGLIKAALNTERRARQRQMALSLLQRAALGRASARLLPLLGGETSAPLRAAAAQLLARYGHPQTVPVLISALSLKPTDRELRAALEMATLHVFYEEPVDPAGAYRDWWAKRQSPSARSLLVRALEQGGLPTEALAGWAKGEALDKRALGEALLPALADGRWWLVHGASRALAEAFEIDRPAPDRFTTPDKRRENLAIWRGLIRKAK